MSTTFAALRKALADDGCCPSGFWGKDQPVCPHCGHECDVSENDWWRLYDEGEHEVSCPHCNEDFTVNTRVSFSFDTDSQEGIDDEDDGITGEGM